MDMPIHTVLYYIQLFYFEQEEYSIESNHSFRRFLAIALNL